jgi:hypothetical protein
VFDVPYFRRKLKEETDRLEVKCKIWTEKINDSLTPDVQDQVIAQLVCDFTESGFNQVS